MRYLLQAILFFFRPNSVKETSRRIRTELDRRNDMADKYAEHMARLAKKQGS